MTLDEFRASIKDAQPPTLPPLLAAMWHDARGDWTRAHEIASDSLEIEWTRIVTALLR